MPKGFYDEAVQSGGIAVVTGAASGVGKVAALRFAEAGFGVLLADLPGDALDAATSEIRAAARDGAPVEGLATDVSRDADVAALADRAFEMGEVAVVMNNAGIARNTTAWGDMDSWRAMAEVNLFGVLRGVHAFTQRMVNAGRPAVIINTGSKQGITTPPGNPGYNLTKAGVRVISEQLAHELRASGAPISVHLFIPGFTYTGMTGQRHATKPDAAWTSEQCVDHFLARMLAGDFYVLCPDNDVTPDLDRRRVTWAFGDIVENRTALSRWDPEYKADYAAFEGREG
ncbi:MAG: SDR family NAD(P)-dependent oxidoreductase [Pseudomonadota bacterium]